MGLKVQVAYFNWPKFLMSGRAKSAHTCAWVTSFAILFLGLQVLGVAVTATPAEAANKSAAMVLDANTGEVLYARNGDAPRYPASLTKMMTLYMVFDELKAGRMTFKTPIKMTVTAAQHPPSKLGLKPGQTILLQHAIRALVTKSANDVAAAVAEHIAGSESAFARRMTQRARSIGMSKTTFKNASGLTQEGQVTTARDMITLALRLQDDHPKHFHLFSTRSFHYGGKTYRNHNTLLRSMRGVNGIKTGYTRASGFNLVTSMHHGQKHLVAAVFGGKTASARNSRMRSLLYSSMNKASKRKTRKPAPMLLAKPKPLPRAPNRIAARTAPTPKPAPAPLRRTDTSGPPAAPGPLPFRPAQTTPVAAAQPRLAQPQPRVAMARVRTVSVLAPQRVARTQLAPVTEPQSPPPAPMRTAHATTFQPLPTLQGNGPQPVARGRPPSTLNQQAALLASPQRNYGAGLARVNTRWSLNGPRPENVAQRPSAGKESGPYHIQIGALPSADLAEQHARDVAARMSTMLSGYRPLTMPVTVRGKQFWRVRFAGFASSHATRTCNELRRNNIDCFVTQP